MNNISIKDYYIQSELGRGGMATVYLAHDNKFDSNVAIKVLNKEFVHNENIRKRFLAEARNMYKMSHPNIIKVTDLIEEGDTVAFVMEYIEGETLKEYLERKGKLSDDEIKTIFSQMLDAVGYVHDKKLVHRDIKPSNFMINSEGQVKLLDFGIAKNIDIASAEYTQTGTGIQMGTPMYMSPEQITETKSVTLQSDIYSLGVVLWQMVTGQKPYDTKTLSTFQLQNKIVNEPLENTHTKWDPIIRKAAAKEIAQRYDSAAAFKKGLEVDSAKNTQEAEATVIENNSKPHSQPAEKTNTAGKPPQKSKLVKLLLFVLLAVGIGFWVNNFVSPDKLNDTVKAVEVPPLSGKLSIDWADIPGGTFTMGRPQNEDAFLMEKVSKYEIQHKVTLVGFKMSKHEITFDQYDSFCDATGRGKPSDEGWGRGKQPVINVSWMDAKAFADWAGAQLPTEAQWEYACRAGTPTPFNTGKCLNANEANYKGKFPYEGCNVGTFQEKTMPVGSYAPNNWGLYEMHGNVSEWCADWYGQYTLSPQTNPQGPLSGSYRVLRGGNWDNIAWDCRSASRIKASPKYRNNTHGFRLVSLK
jgi:serine/threonine protein kinase